METPEKSGRWKRLAFRLMGRERGLRFLAARVVKRTGNQHFTFPVDTAAVKRLLVVFPPDLVDSVYQITNAAAIMERFPQAHRIALAESASRPIAAAVGASEVVEYHAGEMQLFSTALNELSRDFSEGIDCCCLLSRSEELPLLYLAGRSAAPVRIGYADAAPYPFVNFRVNPSAEKSYLPRQNCALAEALGWDGTLKQSWPLDDETTAEVNRLLAGEHLGSGEPLVGIDALSLIRQFGLAWTEACIPALLDAGRGNCYLYAFDPDQPAVNRLSALTPPLFSRLTIPQTVALLYRTECVVAGNGLFYGLATALGVKAVGLFAGNDLARYSMRSRLVAGIPWSREPETLQNVTDAVAGFLS